MRHYVSKDKQSGSLHRTKIFQERPGISLFDQFLSATFLGASLSFQRYILVDGTHEFMGCNWGGVLWIDLCLCRKRDDLSGAGVDRIRYPMAVAL